MQAQGLRAAAFVIGRNVEQPETMRLLEAWSDAGHIVGNHTYSHRRYSRVTFGDFTDDVLRCEAVLRRLPSFRKLLRFPCLDEGATTEQRDRIRAFLVERGYGNAHVTIFFRLAPDVLPAGQSLLWSLAKATGRFDGILRYPG